MEIFNVNNQASRIQRKPREDEERRTQRAGEAAEAKGAREYIDQAELDSEALPTEEAEGVRELAGNDQEEAHEDRQQAGYFEHHEGEQGRRVDLEG